jgi:predicted aspartyl protease
MGRIVTNVAISNVSDPTASLKCDALVDTGAAYMILPTAWRSRLGGLEMTRSVELGLGNQTRVRGEVGGPVRIEIEGFPPIFNEVLFVDMAPSNGAYEPLLGYVILEQSQAAVDMVGHRLIHIKKVDLK